jgi:hypothetical protein
MINQDQLTGKLRLVYYNYRFTTHKIRKLYFSSQQYKNIIDYLHSIIPVNQLYHCYKDVAPYLESITPKDFELLCDMDRIGSLDKFIDLVKLAAKD